MKASLAAYDRLQLPQEGGGGGDGDGVAGRPRVSDELLRRRSFVLLMEFYPLPFQSGQTIKRTTAERDRLTQQ